jgi:hypothetical protein
MVEARRRPEAAHARSAPSPRLILFFITDGGSAAEVKDLTDARMMAAMPPRPVASLLFF